MAFTTLPTEEEKLRYNRLVNTCLAILKCTCFKHCFFFKQDLKILCRSIQFDDCIKLRLISQGMYSNLERSLHMETGVLLLLELRVLFCLEKGCTRFIM